MDQVSTNGWPGVGVVAMPPQVTTPVETRPLPFQFTGTASEYFRIWIVNLLLTICTLGIYSAWAKIRTKRYFYRNTMVDGKSFDYLAKPIPILKGRIIVAVFLGLLGWSQYYSKPVYVGMIILLTLMTPWVAVKSLAFNARNSSYRNIRFAFPARVGEAFSVYLKTAVIYAISCGVGYPWARWTLTRFIGYRHFYGDLQFTWHTKCGKFYTAHVLAALLAIPGYFLLGGLIAGSTFMAKKNGAPDPNLMVAPMVLFFFYFLIPAAYLKAELSNLFFGGLMVGPHYFDSKQRMGALLKIYVLNTLAIVGSLGLLIPWAMIRMAKYKAESLTFLAVGELHSETLLDQETSALGEGMADLGDFDLGIGT